MTTIKDLATLVNEDRFIEVSNQDKLRQVLNNQPPKTWIKDHPLATGVKYIPIDKTEALLDTIFQEWRTEIITVFQLAQSICAIVRLHYKNPVTGEWTFHDGVGAVPLRTDKGRSAADLQYIKSDAVSTGAPAAVSFAIKDAADHIGKLFGRDLNRRDTVKMPGIYDIKVESAELGSSEEDRALNK